MGLVSVTTSQNKVDSVVRAVLVDVLGLSPARAEALDGESGLFGTLPELDSMAVANLLTELEDRLGIIIEDDELDGEMLESFGNLTRFLETKVSA
jgi:acyl carrier protein